MANKEIGNILREYRQKKNYTQQDVANMLQLRNKSTLGSWEVGKSEPDAETFLKLCDIYEVPDILEVFLGIQNHDNPLSLSKFEENLIIDLRKLNEAGKQKVDDYINDLLHNSSLVKNIPSYDYIPVPSQSSGRVLQYDGDNSDVDGINFAEIGKLDYELRNKDK